MESLLGICFPGSPLTARNEHYLALRALIVAVHFDRGVGRPAPRASHSLVAERAKATVKERQRTKFSKPSVLET